MSVRPVPVTVERFEPRRNWVRLAARAVFFCALASFVAGAVYQRFFS